MNAKIKNFQKFASKTSIILLCIYLIVYIFCGCKCLMNSDSAFIVDYSMEQIRLKTFFLTNWYNTNDFWIYSLIPMITVFLKMGMSLFFSRQLAVYFQSVLLIFIVYDIYKSLIKDKIGGIIAVVITLTGISAQALFEIFGDATYGSIIFYMLLELWLFMKYYTKNSKKYLWIFLLILSIITACSLRFPIYIGAPFIVICLIFMFTKFDKKYIYLILGICFSIVIGYFGHLLLSHYALLATSFPGSSINSSEELIYNIQNSLFNYFWINGATNKSVFSLTISYFYNHLSVSSPLIVLLFVKVIVAIYNLIIPFKLIKKYKEFNDCEKILYIFSCSLFCIVSYFLIFGNMSGWYRYVTPIVFFLYLIIPIGYKYLFKNFNIKVLFNLFIVAFVGCTVILNFFSYFDDQTLTFRENPNEYLSEFLVSKDLKFGYTYSGYEHNIYNLISNGKVRVTRIFKGDDFISTSNWLNSQDWFTVDYYNGNVFFMRYVDNDKLDAEEFADEHYTVGTVEIFVFNSHEKFLNLIGLNN